MSALQHTLPVAPLATASSLQAYKHRNCSTTTISEGNAVKERAGRDQKVTTGVAEARLGLVSTKLESRGNWYPSRYHPHQHCEALDTLLPIFLATITPQGQRGRSKTKGKQ